MARKDPALGSGRGLRERGITRMRTPFTADVPDEYGQAQWIPDVPSIEDQSDIPDLIERKRLDPLGLLPGDNLCAGGKVGMKPDIPHLSALNTGGRRK